MNVGLTLPTIVDQILTNFQSHLYYVDINNTLQELYSTDDFTTWQTGSLGDYNVTASTSSKALTAIYGDHWLGQSEDSAGVRLYYGALDNQVHELALFPHAGSQYFAQFVFKGSDGNAGIAAVWQDGPGLGNLYTFDQHGELQIWGNNFNTTHISNNNNNNASLGEWVNSRSP